MQTLNAVQLALLFLGFLLGIAVASPARGPQSPTVIITQPSEPSIGFALLLFIGVMVLVLLVAGPV